jgi:cytochrome c
MQSTLKTLCIGLAAAGSLFAGSVVMADGATLYKEKTCATCHGADAKTPIAPNYPKLAGQNKDYALQQMKDIKSGARNNGMTVAMKGIMMLVNETEMEAIAEWLESLE